MDEEKIALKLSLRGLLITALLVTALVGIWPSIRVRTGVPGVERDYRIPYALSTRYQIYRRLTELSAAQFPTIVVGDSVVWGQTARRNDTLTHHLNELTRQPRFANAGLDGMHPIALAELLEHHAPAIQRKDVLLHFDPLWLMIDPAEPGGAATLINMPGLVPRLAAGLSTALKQRLASGAAGLVRRSPISAWAERFADARLDFLAWTLDHPYANPSEAIAATLPPSEDSHPLKLSPWSGIESAKLDCRWPALEQDHPQWSAFERILSLLAARDNRVLVLVGPMNEEMMSAAMRSGYQQIKQAVRAKLDALGVPSYVAPPLRSEWFSDICHPLGPGYEELARELLKAESARLLGTGSPK